MSEFSNERIQKYITHAMNAYKGDDLERAECAFGGCSETEMSQLYGESGNTCNDILNEYRQFRKLHNSAIDTLKHAGLILE